MAPKIESQAVEGIHECDVISAAFYDNTLYTGGDDGYIKSWRSDLSGCTSTWKAHDYVVYDLAVNPANGDLYSCSLDGAIIQWRPGSTGAVLVNSATQTGPSGKGADLAGLGDSGGLEDTPTTVRRLFWRGNHLYSADELGSVCRWTPDLKLTMKKEYFTEIWSLFVNESETLVYTARDNDVVIAAISPKDEGDIDPTVQVTGNIPGRSPALANKDDSVTVCVSRSGLEIEVWRRAGNSREKFQKLTDHDMIVNCVLLNEAEDLISAGWDAKLNFWKREIDGSYSLANTVKVESYVNVLCYGLSCVYACGKRGYIVKISTQ